MGKQISISKKGLLFFLILHIYLHRLDQVLLIPNQYIQEFFSFLPEILQTGSPVSNCIDI